VLYRKGIKPVVLKLYLYLAAEQALISPLFRPAKSFYFEYNFITLPVPSCITGKGERQKLWFSVGAFRLLSTDHK
jgi:hypothetical protein